MFCDDAVAGSATATARGSNDHFNIRQIVKNLETDNADAGNQLRFVRRMHIAVTFGQGDAFSLSPRFIVITAEHVREFLYAHERRFWQVLPDKFSGYRDVIESRWIHGRAISINLIWGEWYSCRLYWRRVRTASGSDRIIYHLSFFIWHL